MEMIGQAHKTEANGTMIAWSEMGEGAPLLLIHGFQDSHRTWSRVAPLLASDFHVIMIDLPGRGLSGRPRAPYTLEWYSRTLLEWMAAVGISRTSICGHSFGGGIAQWMLLRGRERMDRLALVAPGGLGREVGMWLKYATFPVLGRRLTPLVIRHFIPLVMRFAPAAFGNRDPEEIDHYIRMNRIPGTDEAFQASLEAVINPFGQYMQTWQRCHEIEDPPPIALFWGEKDHVLPVKQGYNVLEQSIGVTLTTYPDCGHFPHLEIPDTFAADLKDFLIDPDRPSGHICGGEKPLTIGV